MSDCLCMLCEELVTDGPPGLRHRPHQGPRCIHLACQLAAWEPTSADCPECAGRPSEGGHSFNCSRVEEGSR